MCFRIVDLDVGSGARSATNLHYSAGHPKLLLVAAEAHRHSRGVQLAAQHCPLIIPFVVALKRTQQPESVIQRICLTGTIFKEASHHTSSISSSKDQAIPSVSDVRSCSGFSCMLRTLSGICQIVCYLHVSIPVLGQKKINEILRSRSGITGHDPAPHSNNKQD